MMPVWWPLFSGRQIKTRVANLESRVSTIENGTTQQERIVAVVQQRLRFLELQAELLARRHLKAFQAQEKDDG